MVGLSRRLAAAAFSFSVYPFASEAQTAPQPDIVVTATRSPRAVTQAGSSISVISGEEIAKASPKSIADVLRRVPGVTVTEAGGPGGSTTVRIRGAEARHTLVLVDGVKVNDPSSGSNEFDFANFVAADIERIEVLRGAQSALYGSDAMGGVINIITRKGSGAPKFKVSSEAGSYGSKGLRGSVSGSSGPVSYAFSLTGYDTAGFSRYGYRIGRIERTRGWPLEPDASRRGGAAGRIGLSLAKDVELEIGGYSTANVAQYDAAFGAYPDTPSQSQQHLHQGYARLTALAFDGLLRNTVLVAANRTERDYRTIGYSGALTLPRLRWDADSFTGDRVDAEYQGDLKLGAFGVLTFGAKAQRERILTHNRPVAPTPGRRRETNDAAQTTHSVFALHQITVFDHLHLSIGGRLDELLHSERFATWRATAAYEIPASSTTIRGSVGTGAKAPTLFQQFDPLFGTPGLHAERSFSIDAGIDQRLFDDRVTLSATVFVNRFRDLIDFSFDPAVCPPTNPFGCYGNVARARTSGLEVAADAEILPGLLRFKAAYTHLEAYDQLTGKRLARRPEDEARVGLIVTPIAGWSIEPSVVLVGKRFSSAGERDRLAPYARLDVYSEYQINDAFSVFARAENLTNAHYQEIRNYGTPGRSFYAGLRATW